MKRVKLGKLKGRVLKDIVVDESRDYILLYCSRKLAYAVCMYDSETNNYSKGASVGIIDSDISKALNHKIISVFGDVIVSCGLADSNTTYTLLGFMTLFFNHNTFSINWHIPTENITNHHICLFELHSEADFEELKNKFK